MASGDWSMGQHEPYWRTNTSFSPPPSRWDFSFPSEDLPYDSPDSNLLQESSTSSSSNESRWMRGRHLFNHQYSASDSAGLLFSSSPDLSPGPQWTPPVIQEINADDYEIATKRGHVLQRLPAKAAMEGTSRNPESRRSTSSCSDSSDSEPTFKSCLSSHRNFTGRRSFLSKPIHPLFFPAEAPRDAFETPSTGPLEFDVASLQRDAHRWSSASSSIDFSDISDSFASETLSRSCVSSDDFRCVLCKKFLSQRSPWSSRRIVRSGDMPVAGVLSCHHVFHAECLEQTTPKAHKNNPPCPQCFKLEGRNSTELQGILRFRNSLPSLRSSEPCGYMPVEDCLEGASHPPQRNTMLLLNRHRMKKNLSLKGNSSKEFPGKLRKTDTYSSKSPSGESVDLGTVGCSKTTAGPSKKRG